jgi:hypothetical protein
MKLLLSIVEHIKTLETIRKDMQRIILNIETLFFSVQSRWQIHCKKFTTKDELLEALTIPSDSALQTLITRTETKSARASIVELGTVSLKELPRVF